LLPIRKQERQAIKLAFALAGFLVYAEF